MESVTIIALAFINTITTTTTTKKKSKAVDFWTTESLTEATKNVFVAKAEELNVWHSICLHFG